MTEQNKFRCEMCAGNVTGTKKLELKSLPPCLVFHLKRFAQVGAKCSDAVGFPMELDMTPFIEASSSPLYDCVAFCSHSGKSSTSGHYTACSRRGAAGWFRFDDSTRPVQVENVNWDHPSPNTNTGLQKQLLSDIKNAYLLFYVRRR
jgi:ubiquitin C-terminal hydrolase